MTNPCASHVSRRLSETNFAITLAADGAQALESAGRESFDVALLDLKMPGIPGMEVLRRLKQISPGLTVIIITGYPAIDSAVEAIKQGAYDYLPKPFTPEVADGDGAAGDAHCAREPRICMCEGRAGEPDAVGCAHRPLRRR